MKLYCSKIILFFLTLNILVTSSSCAHNNNEPSITPHRTQIYISRVLSEGDTQSSNYDKDTGMKSVMQQFVASTSQRFQEYEERMREKRQKRKEQRDKNIQKIIEKDKRDKSLAEKIEKGCLRCGCGLGGVAASVGLFGGLGIYGWKISALATVKEVTISEGASQVAAAKGASEGLAKFIQLIESTFSIKELNGNLLETLFTSNTYTDVSNIPDLIYSQYNATCIKFGPGAVPFTGSDSSFCSTVTTLPYVPGYVTGDTRSTNVIIQSHVKKILEEATAHAGEATEKAIEEAIATLTKEKTSEIAATCMGHQTAIIASVVALLIIALVMIIIYLVLRYRRKKKINKKAEYTKLINQ
ncbi:rifin PIR protein,putative [Plasmodium sp. DRC-Itaito]|nr:rifin PIR protein,putative [Plasmodium sp. DRC-Itaito]